MCPFIHFPISPFPRTFRVLPVLLAASVLGGTGCARVPEEARQVQVQRRLIINFTVAGKINPLYYYFIAIDTQGDPSAGPVPVVSAPWGNGWGTGSITHYVLYHQGAFTVYKMREGTNLLVGDPLGIPFEFNRPEITESNQIRVVLDLDTLAPLLDRINLNIITTDRIDVATTYEATKIYDGLGTTGNLFVNLPVRVSQVFTNTQSTDPERAGDLPPQPTPTIERNDLDITDWAAEVRLQ